MYILNHVVSNGILGWPTFFASTHNVLKTILTWPYLCHLSINKYSIYRFCTDLHVCLHHIMLKGILPYIWLLPDLESSAGFSLLFVRVFRFGRHLRTILLEGWRHPKIIAEDTVPWWNPNLKLSPASLFPEAMLVLGSAWDTTVQPVLGEKSKMLDGYLNLFYMFYGQLAMLVYERLTCKCVLSWMIPILNWLVRRNSDSSIANNFSIIQEKQAWL